MSMAASQLMPPRSSTKPLISGSPSIGNEIRKFADDLDRHFSTALRLALGYARSDLRNTAKSNQAWAPFADVLDVKFDGEDFSYVVTGTPEQQSEAMELEYGTPERSPNSLLRKKALSQSVVIGKIMGDYLSKEIPSA